MSNNKNVYFENDVLGVPAENEADAKYKAIEHLEFLKKACIKVIDAKKADGRTTYDVAVEYMDPEDYEKIEGKVSDIIYVPTSSEFDAKYKARETLEFQKKQYINIKNAQKIENKENYAVEVEYVEEGPKLK